MLTVEFPDVDPLAANVTKRKLTFLGDEIKAEICSQDANIKKILEALNIS